jgi:hypothetical protein
VAKKFSFRYRPLAIQVSEGREETLVEDIAEIGPTLFHEIAQIASELEKTLVGRYQLSRRALGTFRRIREKLNVLSFIEPRAIPILDRIDGFLDRVPSSGPINGSLFNEGYGLWSLLCDEHRLLAHANSLIFANAIDPAEDDAALDDELGAILVPEIDPASEQTETDNEWLAPMIPVDQKIRVSQPITAQLSTDELFGDNWF